MNVPLILVASTATLWWYVTWKRAQKTEIWYDKSSSKMTMISRMAFKDNQTYKPPLILFSAYGQLALLILREIYYNKFVRFASHEEVISLPDGGVSTIEWDVTETLPADAPIVCFLHTLTGSTHTTKPFLTYARSRGWRACVLNRRGHTKRLSSPHFNIMGHVEDTVLMLNAIRAKHPKTFIGLVGISAGSGQLINYLGKEGSKAVVDGCACLCPAYDLSVAFERFDAKSPWLSRFLSNSLKKLFLVPNEEMLVSAHGKESYHATLGAKTMNDFIRNHHLFAGTGTFEQYLKEHNPLNVFMENKVPCLVMNARDDPVCLEANIPFHRLDHTITNAPYCVCVTASGSHISYAEGFFGTKSWMERVTMDWLEAVRKARVSA